MDMGIRGLIHSNIPVEKEWTLIDGNSGNKIGTYPLAGAVPGDTVILGGACWKIVKMGDGKIYARRTAAGLKGAAFSRRASRSAFHRFLPPAYK
jgi:aspartate 1-decarboxylase